VAAKNKGERKATAGDAKGRYEKLEEIESLLMRAHEGDKAVLPALREALDMMPKLARKFVDPADQAERTMVQNYAGDDLLVKEAMPRTLKLMREELAGHDPSPLERLLVERVVASWFQLQYFEGLYSQNIRNLTIPQAEFHQKRIDRAHRRHLSAIRTLAQVRKMIKPGTPQVAHINVAEKQINTTNVT
jgi:hypothetical protein